MGEHLTKVILEGDLRGGNRKEKKTTVSRTGQKTGKDAQESTRPQWGIDGEYSPIKNKKFGK